MTLLRVALFLMPLLLGANIPIPDCYPCPNPPPQGDCCPSWVPCPAGICQLLPGPKPGPRLALVVARYQDDPTGQIPPPVQ